MESPEKLNILLREKLKDSPGYWAARYEEALERIQDFTSEEESPYWYSPANIASGLADEEVILDDLGGEYTPDQAREQAWELLVLADLVEMGES